MTDPISSEIEVLKQKLMAAEQEATVWADYALSLYQAHHVGAAAIVGLITGVILGMIF